ncbi:hypothetical protein MKS88_001571 [Plasmodium brasilianum]|uniref:Uncharacterized protein n=1 Tax=Plasmodium brasilianum TaxID=5824 RepID=A0ACB9YDN2_PLABR|nr:hypothetical protein MKS88_001571 [Plasmodium brasilianum]
MLVSEHGYDIKLELINFRLLAKWEEENDSNIIKLEKEITNYEENNKKKFFKKLDYIDFIRKKPSISNKTYHKLVSKKFGHKMFLPILVLSWLILAPLGGFIGGLFDQSKGLYISSGSSVNVVTIIINECAITFFVLLGILIVIFMICSAFTYMKFRKHKRTKKRKY